MDISFYHHKYFPGKQSKKKFKFGDLNDYTLPYSLSGYLSPNS